MKKYMAIGYFKFKGKDSMQCIVSGNNTKDDFMHDLRVNEFVPYAVITGPMLRKLTEEYPKEDNYSDLVWEQVQKLTTNYRIWDTLTEYVLQCADIMQEKWDAYEE